MSSENDLSEARGEAEAILALCNDDLSKMFFERTMRRNLTRTVRHLDRLIRAGGEDKTLGQKALSRLGFSAQD